MTVAERIVAAVVADPDRAGCREWPTDRSLSSGYPRAKIGGRTGKTVLVSHLVLVADGRPRPTSKHLALHSCDRPICIAPWHLRWGTHADNMEDALERGQMRRGQRARWAKVTDGQADAIRHDLRLQAEIAAQYGVSQSTVSRIKAGLRYLPEAR